MSEKIKKGAKSFLRRTMDDNRAKMYAEFIGAMYSKRFWWRFAFALKLIFRIRR